MRMKKKEAILTLKGHFKKQRKKFFAGGFLVIGLAVIILLNFAFGQINYLPNKFLGKFAVKNLTNLIEKFSIQAQIMPEFFFPNFPQRLMYATSEISAISEELVTLNEELLALTNECGCQFAQSQCQQIMTEGIPTDCKPGPIKIFGTPCALIGGGPDETDSTIGGKRAQISDLTMRLSSLQKLLQEEMDVALERQLETLRPEDAQILRDNLNKLLELSPQIEEVARDNMDLPDNCDVKKCSPQCQLGTTFGLEACAKFGEQKPNIMNFEAGVTLDDLKLGEVGTKNINLSLPEEIDMPDLPALPAITISIPDITLTCPTESRTITFQTPTPSLPESPTLTLGCPRYPNYSSYQCIPGQQTGEGNFKEFEWWSITFSWLSEQCQGLLQGEYGTPATACLDPEEVVPAIVNECDRQWNECGLPSCPLIPSICQDIGAPSGFSWKIPWVWQISREEAAIRNCQDLFTQEGETPPASCDSDAIGTTENKCDQIRDSGVEKPPEPCKLLPLFVGQLEAPPSGIIVGPDQSCPAQEIGDYPNTPMTGCSLAFPSIPTISFPKIIIPDIYLPSFSLGPFFSVKLPNFIFEDLVIPDIELCNLDECQFKFPYLSFKIPSLKIPEIKVPPVSLDIPGVPELKVEVAPIQYQSLYFNFPQLINLASLTTPELEMPSIPLPQPKLQMSFAGLDIDFLDLLLGLFKLPSNVCVSLDASFRILNIVYPDYIFSWPAFSRIPEIPFCKDARTFCQNANASIQEVTAKTDRIEDQINTVFQSEIQQQLDQLAIQINQEITSEIQAQLNTIADTINEALLAHLARYAPENVVYPNPIEMPGVWRVAGGLPCDKVPPLTIPMNDINISPKPLSSYAFFPDKIFIDWPPELEKFALINELGYELPTIPLSILSYLKEANIRLPGFQLSSPTLNTNLIGKGTSCISQPPSGGNPCPTGEIQANLEEIIRLEGEVDRTSQNITDVLE